MSPDLLDAASARVAPSRARDALRAVPVLPRALLAPPRATVARVRYPVDAPGSRAHPWQVASLVAWQLDGRNATVRRLHDAAHRLATGLRSDPAAMDDAKRRAEWVLDTIADLPSGDRLAVVFTVLRDLLDDVEAAEGLDRVIADAQRHHKVDAPTAAQRDMAARIVAEVRG